MPVTPVYGWPFQSGGERPHGPNLGSNLALGIEATVAALEARLAAAEAALAASPLPYRARQTVTGAAVASVTFSGIPSTLRRVRVIATTRGTSGGIVDLLMQVNGDSTAKYSYRVIDNNGFTAALSSTGGSLGTSIPLGKSTGAASDANKFGVTEIVIASWDAPHTGFLQILSASGSDELGTVQFGRIGRSWYQSAGPYTSLTFSLSAGNIDIGSDFQLEGAVA